MAMILNYNGKEIATDAQGYLLDVHQWEEGLAQLWCKEKLASFKVPKYYFFETIPRTSTGKIQKYLLRDKAKKLISN